MVRDARRCRTPYHEGLDHLILSGLARVSKDESESTLKIPRNQFAHDFRGAAVNSQHARIGIQAADFVLAHEAVAAEELQALIDDPAMHFRDPQFGGGGC